MNIEDIENEMKQDNELLIIYRKGMSSSITNMLQNQWMVSKIVNRELILDTVGKYNIIYSMDTNIQKICDLLNREWNNPIQEMMMDDKPEPLQMNFNSVEV